MAFTIGAFIGLRRDARLASLRFLAENAHRAPTTKEGWYYYHKTKNYKVALAGLKGAGRDGLFLAMVTLGWVGIEEGFNRVGWGQISMSGASLGTSALFSAAYRLPWKTTRQAMGIGLVGGGCMDMLRWVTEKYARKIQDGP